MRNGWVVIFLFAPVLITTGVGLESGEAAESESRVEHTSVALSDPDCSALLVVRIPYASITVVGVEGSRIDVRASLLSGNEAPGKRPGIAPSSVPIGISPEEFDNVVEVLLPHNQRLIDVEIYVPRRTSVQVFGANGGPITIEGVEGIVEVENSNAAVFLKKIHGSALVSTSNGHIGAEFLSVDRARDMSFITSNASVELILPEDVHAWLFLETDNGDFVSDFEIKPAPLPPGREPFPRSSMMSLFGKIGDGGTEIRVRTNNNSIFLRKGGERGRP